MHSWLEHPILKSLFRSLIFIFIILFFDNIIKKNAKGLCSGSESLGQNLLVEKVSTYMAWRISGPASLASACLTVGWKTLGLLHKIWNILKIRAVSVNDSHQEELCRKIFKAKPPSSKERFSCLGVVACIINSSSWKSGFSMCKGPLTEGQWRRC